MDSSSPLVDEFNAMFGQSCMLDRPVSHSPQFCDHLEKDVEVLPKPGGKLYVPALILCDCFLIVVDDIFVFCHLFQAVGGRLVVNRVT